MARTVEALAGELKALRDALVTLARLETLVRLGERGLELQEARAAEAVKRLEEAALLDDYLRSSHAARVREIAWPVELREKVRVAMEREQVELPRAKRLLSSWRQQTAALHAGTLKLARSSPLFAAARLRLESIQLVAIAGEPSRARELPEAAPGLNSASSAVEKVMRGPAHAPLDRRFRPTFSLLRTGSDPSITGDDLDRAPHYWCLAAREAMASELCALNLLEYDGLPLAYYRDFAKQQWDELRHAVLFLAMGLEVLPEFVAQAPRSHPLRAAAAEHLKKGTGLPIALEGNLYELARDTTLMQRLVLMHHDTETPGVGAFLEQARSPWVRARPRFADAIYTTVHDEASHARIGRRWMKHLAPSPQARSQAIEETRALRGVLLLSAMAASNQLDLGDLAAGRGLLDLPSALRAALAQGSRG